ncbi:MAG: DUF2283 domain-containing protein [Hormoscilla sp. GM7CHS1pb]|nr:DUF2283 domain-containing protein [Hormoscilla sp. GM7CHS1pb]
MKVKYDTEADILMFMLRDGFPVNAISEPGGVIVSYDENDDRVSIEVLNASKRKLFNPQDFRRAIATRSAL